LQVATAPLSQVAAGPLPQVAAGPLPQAAAGQLSRSATFYLEASIVVALLAGSAAPTPLYATYQAAWGFSPITVTVVFAVYALAVLSALLVLGSLSDYVGRRPVILAALVLQATTMLTFAFAGGVGDLIFGRILQGVSTGAAVAALGAGLLDIDRPRGTTANAIAPMLGTATGGLSSGLLVQYLPLPTHLVFVLLCAVFVLQALAMLYAPETALPRPGALAALRPQLRLPPALRGAFLRVLPIAVATWALVGFYAALAPTLLRQVLGLSSPLLGGLSLFVFAASGVLSLLATRGRSARALLTLGATALLTGVGVSLLALEQGSSGGFFAGTALSGAGFGTGFQGVLRGVVPLAAPAERASVLSVLYVVCYLAMGVPAVIAGVLVVHSGALVTAREVGAAVMGLAALALCLRGR
jgi:MFS family permease